jgi:hypothetical protein
VGEPADGTTGSTSAPCRWPNDEGCAGTDAVDPGVGPTAGVGAAGRGAPGLITRRPACASWRPPPTCGVGTEDGAGAASVRASRAA